MHHEVSAKVSAFESVLKVHLDEVSMRVDKLQAEFNENKSIVQIQIDKINNQLGEKVGFGISNEVYSSSDD